MFMFLFVFGNFFLQVLQDNNSITNRLSSYICYFETNLLDLVRFKLIEYIKRTFFYIYFSFTVIFVHFLINYIYWRKNFPPISEVSNKKKA